MDRLSALILCGLAVSCTEPSAKPGAKSDRVAAVEAAPAADPAAQAAEWCDVMKKPGEGPAFAYPTLEQGQAGKPGAARWVNVWATWCGPCVEELPRIETFRERLAKDGARVQVELLAADGPEELAGFVAKHPAAKSSLRIADPDGLGAWLSAIGLSDSAGLPIHLFVDGEDRLRCARLGGVGEDDYAAVLAVLRSM
jgi:thiol-disulfide isomerase/thioredoxin